MAETIDVGTGKDTGGTIEPQPDASLVGQPCYGGAAPSAFKPYWYIVQPEDLSSFWQIPTKFNLPTKTGQRWTWQALRDANQDWPGGMAKDAYGACVLQNLFTGAKLAVPADWPEPKPGVKTEPRKDIPDPTKPKQTVGIAGIALLVAGLAGATILTIAVARAKRRS